MDRSELCLVSRVWLRSAGRIGDPKELLTQFESAVRTVFQADLSRVQQVYKEALEIKSKIDPGDLPYRGIHEQFHLIRDLSVSLRRAPDKLSDPGHRLFLSLLQEYTLPAPIRKKVEIASRVYLKASKPRFKGRGFELDLNILAAYLKNEAVFQSHVELAKKAIAEGKPHSEEGPGATKMKVGPFTLVNTGGFSSDVMSNVSDVVQKATSLI